MNAENEGENMNGSEDSESIGSGKQATGLQQFLKENGVEGAHEKLVAEGVETVNALFLLTDDDVTSMPSLSVGHKRLLIQVLATGREEKARRDPLFSFLKDQGVAENLIPTILDALRERGGVTTSAELRALEGDDVAELRLAVLPRKALRGVIQDLKRKQQEEAVARAESSSKQEARERVQLLGLAGKDVEALDETGRPPIVKAAAEGDLERLRLLVRAGSGPDVLDKHGCSAAHWAAANGKRSCLEFLSQEKASLSRRCNHGTTPAWNAAFHGRYEILEFLAARGADLSSAPTRGPYAGQTPYRVAEERGHPEEARLIEQNT